MEGSSSSSGSSSKTFQKGIGPKKAFLSRIRSASRESLSEYYSNLTDSSKHSGLDLLADVISPTRTKSDSLCRSEFSAGSNLSLGLPDDIKNCLTELEENALDMDDVDFTATPCDSPPGKDAPSLPAEPYTYLYTGEESKDAKLDSVEYTGNSDRNSGDQYETDRNSGDQTGQSSEIGLLDNLDSYTYNDATFPTNLLSDSSQSRHTSGHGKYPSDDGCSGSDTKHHTGIGGSLHSDTRCDTGTSLQGDTGILDTRRHSNITDRLHSDRLDTRHHSEITDRLHSDSLDPRGHSDMSDRLNSDRSDTRHRSDVSSRLQSDSLDTRRHNDMTGRLHSESSVTRRHSDIGGRIHSDSGDSRNRRNTSPAGPGQSSVSSTYMSSMGSSSIDDWDVQDATSKLTATDPFPDSQVSTVGSTGDVMPKRKTASPRRSSKTRKLDDVLCQVCGDVAAGFYCGAYICEACKKFYMRAHKQEKLKYVCLREKQCVVTKESRVQCQYCRYQKCLSLNMYSPKQAGGEGGAPAKDTQMSEIPCRVCSAPSSGFHFGAITCEGCKGFFRRMAKERDPERYQCSKSGDCEINMMTRNLCKACRYNRCTKVGMSIEGSRIGRQPNSVKHAISLELKGKGGIESSTPANLVTIKQEPVDSDCDSASKSSKPGQWNDWMDSINEGRAMLESVPAIPNMCPDILGEQPFVPQQTEVELPTSIEPRPQYATSCDTLPTQPKSRTDDTKLHRPITTDTFSIPSTSLAQSQTQDKPPGNGVLVTTLGKSVSSNLHELIDRYSDTADTSGDPNKEKRAEERLDSFNESKGEQLITEIVEAGKCLELLNYRVFDSEQTPSGFKVKELMSMFRNKYMAPGASNTVEPDWSNYESKDSTWSYIMTAFNDLSYIALRFAKHLPGFQSLCLNDQVCLLQSCIYPVILLNLSKSYDRATKRYNYFNFTEREKEKIWEHFPMLQVLGSHFIHVGEMVKTFNLSDDEVSLLSALLMYPSEITGLENPREVQYIQEDVTRALQHYEQMHYSDGLTRFGILLVRIAELVQCRLQHNLSLGLLLARNPDLCVPQLFHELIVDSFSDVHA